ncbi:hypothetical protein BDW42DRAFT_196874 [Aspergillus taichungensis]|uniref:Uncharacterized protein n=1 Tax=Aspergillus taichungensis TaxID=482145 RepID=A0A2J5HIN4_9EURO|nr:hypothetical protein BDW42DRAFT_196874 [Aspergillus taichungensis]
MQPPSNSILHHMHKLSEASRTRRARRANRPDPRPPPPPYTPREQEEDADNDDDDDINEEDYDDEFDEDDLDDSSHTGFAGKITTSSSRVTLHIDGSINVSGDRNTIILPCRPSAAPSTPPPVTAGTSSATPSALDALQHQQQSKLAALATEIISAALQDRRRIFIPATGRRQPLPLPLPPAPPVDIKIDVGVKVRGTGNVVCLDAKAGGPVRKRRQEKEVISTGEVMGGRKRRALSEPCEIPEARRV